MRLMLRITLFFQETQPFSTIESFNIEETDRLPLSKLAPLFRGQTRLITDVIGLLDYLLYKSR